MRMFGKLVLALGVSALLASPAFAQGRGRGFGGGGAMLLGNESVQTELKVDDGQKDKLKSLAEETNSKMREAFQSLQDVPQEERQEKMREKMKEVNEGMEKSLVDILRPEQMKRFKQITRQVQGIQALLAADTQKEMKITDEQKGKLEELANESQTQSREIFQNAGDDRAAAMEKITALRKETNEKALNLLTDAQKKQWKEMTGEPFEVKFQRPGN